MAHQTSAAALRTARVILRNYDLAVRPPDSLVSGKIDKLTNSEAHVAIIIDHATNIFELVKLRPEISFWQQRLKFGNATAPQLAAFLKKISETFDLLPKGSATDEPVITTFAPPTQHENAKPVVLTLSKPAKEVSRFIFHYYLPKPKSESVAYDEILHRLKIAHFAEATLGLKRTYEFMPKLQAELKRLIGGRATELEIKKCMRDMGIVLEYIPSYEDRQEQTKILT